MAVRRTQAVSHLEDTHLERQRFPLSLYLAATVVVMNISATVLSLMAS